MSRSVNKVQNEIMLNKMEKNETFARGFVKIPKEVLSEFWNGLTEELNSAGPPNKNVSEWKKVWIDQKRYVRSKAAADGKRRKQTKGLTENEQRILELVGIKEVVEGLDNTLKYAKPKNLSDNDKEINPFTPSLIDLEEPEDLPCCSKQVAPPSLDKSNKEATEKSMDTITIDEQRILELVGINEAVEVLNNTLSFAKPKNVFDDDIDIKPVTPFLTDLEGPEELPCCSNHNTPPSLDKSNKESPEKAMENLTTDDPTATETLTEESLDSPTKEIETEENLSSQITQLCDSVKSDSKEVEIGIKRVFRALEKGNELRAKKLKLQEQHYARIEKLRSKEVESKIEKNKKLIEIEEMKLKMLIFLRK